ncbi:DUF4307 domain-containing protein [Thermobispora bispora]|nr:DUF4307 domain-containing protein [Actinomycetales bacterium]QSI49377.1 DUF4307 domain-containing protein [Thermobispora bispora]
MVAAPLLDSSSGCAWTAISLNGSLTGLLRVSSSVGRRVVIQAVPRGSTARGRRSRPENDHRGPADPGDPRMSSDQASAQGNGQQFRPILGTPGEFPSRPAGRGRILGYLIIGLVVAMLVVGWGTVLLISRGNPIVDAQVIRISALSPDSTEITMSVSKPADRAAVCRVQAIDTYRMEVGSREVRIPAGDSKVTVTERLRTTGQAVGIRVTNCDLV